MNHFCRLLCLFMLFPNHVLGQHKLDIEDVAIEAWQSQDSLHITIATSIPKMQLSFLMQGMKITIMDTLKHQTLSVELPNARMVKNKIKHHPNEVKAMHRATGDEVRPDLFPLISALNDTCSIAESNDNQVIRCSHIIMLDKTIGEMTFDVCLLLPNSILLHDTVLVEILSSPVEVNVEFDGRRLSQENRMPPDGMGQPPKNICDQARVIRFSEIIQIKSRK